MRALGKCYDAGLLTEGYCFSHQLLRLFLNSARAPLSPQDRICIKNKPMNKQEFTSYQFLLPLPHGWLTGEFSMWFTHCVYLSSWLNLLIRLTNSLVFSSHKEMINELKWQWPVSLPLVSSVLDNDFLHLLQCDGTIALLQYSWTVLNMASCG